MSEPATNARRFRWHGLALVALKGLVSALILLSGFRAVSDDDYAHVVIAQRFAELPSLDPSGTSWLPLPFWVYGSTASVFGTSLHVARAVAILLGILTTLLVYQAARWLGSTRGTAFIAAALSTTLSYAAWLGVATVPDGPTAALLVLSAASLSQTGVRPRGLGALAVGAACWCRYEAWPVALAFAVFTCIDARRSRSPQLLAAALLACVPSLLWMLHGVLHHDGAWFFFKRVSDYRRALGGSGTPFLPRLFELPISLLRFEPQLTLLCLAAIYVGFRHGLRNELARYRRAALALSALLVFLVAGELSDGAPTHHSERTLLSIWFLMCILSADLLLRARLALTSPERKRLAVYLGAGICATALLRPYLAQHGAFANREHELDIGKRARLLGVAKLGLLSEDYGYFAIIAGFGQPSRTVALSDHDPRSRNRATQLKTPENVLDSLTALGVRTFVAPRSDSRIPEALFRLRESNPKFGLFELRNLKTADSRTRDGRSY